MTELTGQNDIANEVEAIAFLFEDETAHSQMNLVRVFGWGLLNPLEYTYFIDMELCEFDLQSQIRFVNDRREVMKAMVSTDATAGTNGFQEALLVVKHTVNTLRDIILGLGYLHGRELVHRDLKPANGTHTLLFLPTNHISAFLSDFKMLETLRFRLHLSGVLRPRGIHFPCPRYTGIQSA